MFGVDLVHAMVVALSGENLITAYLLQVSQELFAAGVSLVEEALEADQQLAALMAANDAAQQAHAAAQAEGAAR